MKLCPICATAYPAEHRTCPTHGAVLVETAELPAGTVIRDCYRIDRVLGKGGMGIVYLAEHTLMGEPRALKFLSSSLASNPTFVQRFLQEARAANKLRHPNIAQTFELGQTEDGSFYISMEFVDGPSLRALLEQAPDGLPPDRVFNIVRGVAEGLGAAHAKHIVHRDIKPENILLAWSVDVETAKVVDFGIVAMSDGAGRLTQTGHPLLTAEYASPEQWRGTYGSSDLDGRTDLYALGCMFFEMLTGRLPFKSDSYEGWFEQHVHVTPPAPSSVRPELARYPGLDALVLRLLAKERDNRPANVREFLTQLDRVVEPASPPPLPIPVAPPPPRSTFNASQRPQTILEVPGQPGKSTGPAHPPSFRSGPPPLPQTSGPTPVRVPAAVSGPTPPVAGATPPVIPHSGPPAISQAAPPPIPPSLPPLIPGLVSNQASLPKPGGSSRKKGMLFGFLGALVIVAVLAVAVYKMTNKETTAKNETPPPPTANDDGVQPNSVTPPPPGPVPAPRVKPDAGTKPVPGYQPHNAEVPQPSSAEATAAQARTFYANNNYGQALPLFSQACSQNHSDSCNYLGWMYQHKLGVDQDYPRAVGYYDKGCKIGSAAACSNLGVMYQDHLGVTQDYVRAVALYTQSCNGNFAIGCDNLGYMYRFSRGVTQDYPRAVALFTKACDGGSMSGCKDLGWMNQYKLGTDLNLPKAASLYGKACDGNVLEACNNLGYLYQHKMGVELDYPKAMALYKKACDGDEPSACNNLGVMYEDKQGVAQDYVKAASLYQKACDGGNANGCSDLGDLYRTGDGVPKDIGKARALLTKGCNMGNQWGCDRLKTLPAQ
jgi:TPR repeat protein/serine/threonine protein kinase